MTNDSSLAETIFAGRECNPEIFCSRVCMICEPFKIKGFNVAVQLELVTLNILFHVIFELFG